MKTARMTYWTTENFVCGIFSSRPGIPVTICCRQTQRLWPSNALHAALQSWRSAPPWSCLPRAMPAGALSKTSSVPGTAFTRVALYRESRRAVSPDRTAHVIDFLKRPGAQTETLCGKLEREKARQPRGAAGQKRRSCLEKKALRILTVVTLSRERYSQRRTNQLCRRKITSRR